MDGNISHPRKKFSIGMAVEFNDHSAAAWVAKDNGWFREAGINFTAFESYLTGLRLAAALARGGIQVGAGKV